MSNQKAERPKRPRSPQKRTRHTSCPFLWKGRVKSISSRFREKPPAGRHTNCEPSGAGRSWKGGARERADGVFCAPGIKRRRSKADFAPTWSGVRESNPPIRLGKHIGQIFYIIRITKKHCIFIAYKSISKTSILIRINCFILFFTLLAFQ